MCVFIMIKQLAVRVVQILRFTYIVVSEASGAEAQSVTDYKRDRLWV